MAFALADHAVVESGKLYVSGGFWSGLNLPSFPAVLNFAVFAVLHVPSRAYLQSHKFLVYFEDADSKELGGRFEGEFRVGAGPHMRTGDPTILPFAAPITNFVIERPGDYACVLKVDGSELDRWNFRTIHTIALPDTVAGGMPDDPGPLQPGLGDSDDA
ncbi:MAG: DUF6941 family protein [Pseudonocardiaceae bacterium]